ncbi:C3a anaphylatoxin chemotactic receptor-like [Xenopus tropicalis]|uniref:C3a anaphylatoxin chemotactic receptor-like n=1 Tax=Xenopus tropicalis TaxID=8364 RepID=A0A803J388_XENTR|nr:C3a anaphylatoxin chemotactic receptor-like [Xenopus tropicalis]
MNTTEEPSMPKAESLTADPCRDSIKLQANFTQISEPVRYASFVLSVLTCALGLVGNALVIWVTGFHMKKHRSKIWFLNLAVADFAFALCLPLYCVALFTDNWPIGRYSCKVYNYVSTCNMYASIFIITTLTIDRVLATAKPIWHHKFASRRICYSTCAVIWVITALSSLPVFLLSETVIHGENVQCKLVNAEKSSATLGIRKRQEPQSGSSLETLSVPETSCDVDIAENYFLTKSILIPFLVVGYFIPLLVILFSNIIIAHQAGKSQSVKSPRLYRIIIVVILFFFLTWTPVVIAQIILLVSLNNHNLILMSQIHRIMPLMTSIAYTNSCINPFIYALAGTQLREEISGFISSTRKSLSKSSTSGRSYVEQ